ATAKKLAASGMSVCAVHRDRRGAMERIEKDFDEIRSYGKGLLTLNLDALSAEGIQSVLGLLREKMGANGRVHVLLHSIAYGNLKPIAPAEGSDTPVMEEEDMARTIHSMGTSLLSWVQQLHKGGLFASDARVL